MYVQEFLARKDVIEMMLPTAPQEAMKRQRGLLSSHFYLGHLHVLAREKL
jgi:hypothetical protein